MAIDKKLIQQLIEQAQQGHQSAFSKLLEWYWDEVYYYIHKSCKNEEQTEDITIQSFAKAFENIHTYNDAYAFNTWIISIAKNLHIDLLRRKHIDTIDLKNTDEQEQKLGNIADLSPNIEDQIIYEQNLATLQQHLKKLPEHYQEMIQLRFFQEKTYKEIAHITHEPLNTVKVKLLRAKKMLIKAIQSTSF